MSNFWNLDDKDKQNEVPSIQQILLDEYQLRKNKSYQALQEAKQKLSADQIASVPQQVDEPSNVDDNVPQITVDFSADGTDNQQTSNEDLYNITKAVDDTTVPEAVISSQIDNTIKQEKAKFYDPNSLSSYSTLTADTTSVDPALSKTYSNANIPSSAPQITADFTTSKDTSSFSTPADTSLYNITPPMTSTNTSGITQMQVSKDVQAQLYDPNKLNSNNTVDLNLPSNVSIPSRLEYMPNISYPESKASKSNVRFEIKNKLSMPNPSISKTTSTMTPTDNEKKQKEIDSAHLGDQQYSGIGDGTSSDGKIPKYFIKEKIASGTANSGNNAESFKETFENMLSSAKTFAKTLSLYDTDDGISKVSGVEFTRTLAKQLSESDFIKNYSNKSVKSDKNSLHFNNSKMASILSNENSKDSAASLLNKLLGLNLTPEDYKNYFTRKSVKDSYAIENSLRNVTLSDLKSMKFDTSTEDAAEQQRLANMLVHYSQNMYDLQNADGRAPLKEDVISKYTVKAVSIVKSSLADPNISKLFLSALMLEGYDPLLKSDKADFANELSSISMYVLLFGADNAGNALQKLINEYSTNDKNADKVFGSLPYAMSEVYETVQSGNDAFVEQLRQNIISQIQETPDQFHILTSMDKSLPEARTLEQIANEGNPKSAFAIMQPITSATNIPFDVSELGNDPTLRNMSGADKETNSDGSELTPEERKKKLKDEINDVATNKAETYAQMLKATNITPGREFLYESVNDKGIFAEKINFALDNLKASKITPDHLTPYVSVSFFKDNNWLVTKVPTMFMYAAVISADIEKDRDNPAATAVIALSNTTGVLTDFGNNQYTTQYTGAGQKVNMPGIFVEPGMNIQVRMGYNPHFSKMDVVFNGFVDGVQTGETLIVTASSFGAELLKPAYNGNEHIGVMLYAHPRDMVVNALSHVKSYHLGAASYFDWIGYNEKQRQTTVKTWLSRIPVFNAVSGLFSQDSKYFQNIFAPDKYWPSGSLTDTARAGKFLDHVSMYLSRYEAHPGFTAWKVIKDAANRMPGFVAAVRNADERQTVFFGYPEYPYRFTYHPSLYSTNSVGEQGLKIYSNVIKAHSTEERAKLEVNNFNNKFENERDDIKSAYFDQLQRESNPDKPKSYASIADDFASVVLESGKTFSGIISGQFPILDSRFQPSRSSTNISSGSQMLDAEIELIRKYIKDTADNAIKNISELKPKDKSTTDTIIATIESLESKLDDLYGKDFKAAKANFVSVNTPLSEDTVAYLTMACSNNILNLYSNAIGNIETAMYNASHGATDFHTRMVISKEMYKMRADSVKPYFDNYSDIPWQLVPRTGKIPATIDGSTMFRRYWAAHSSLNLIENDVSTDPQSAATSVTCFGNSVYSGWDWASGLINRLIKFIATGQNSIPEEVGTINGHKMYGFKVSASKYIIPEDRHDEVYVDENANMPQIRAYVAGSVLADKMMRGYNGSFTMINNYLIEPYDSVLLTDDQTNMHGLVDVRKVMIHLSRQTGLITRVVPDMKVGIRDLTLSFSTRLTHFALNIAQFALETAVMATSIASAPFSGGLTLGIAALGALSIHGTVKNLFQSFLPSITVSTRGTFVRDISLDASDTTEENGIKYDTIEWKFDNAMMLYPLFIGDTYYMPRMRGYNYRDRPYWDDTWNSWKIYWNEVGAGINASAEYFGAIMGADSEVFKNSLNAMRAQSNFSSDYIDRARTEADKLGGN